MKKLPKHVHGYIDRLGTARHYYKRAGSKPVALPGLPWSPDFMAEYEAAHAAYEQPDSVPLGSSRTMAGTLNAALVRYYESGGFKDLAPGTRDMRRNLLERWRADHGALPLRPLRSKHIQAYISKLESKATQRNTLSSIRHFTKFALGAAMIDEDPALSVTRAKLKNTGGFKTWSEEDLAQFETTYPVGTKERLAMALMLYLGVRRSDAVRIGPQHIKGAVLHEYLPKKGEHTGGNLINVPVHPELAKIIAATSVIGTRTFLVTSFGKPFTANGFGNWMRDRMVAAKLTGDPSPNHGLRKLCCVRLAEAGCTAPEIAAITGHKDLREVQVYIEAANRKKLAKAGMSKQVAADVDAIKG